MRRSILPNLDPHAPGLLMRGLLVVSLPTSAAGSKFASANNVVGVGDGASQSGATCAPAISCCADRSWESSGAASATMGEPHGFASVTAKTDGVRGRRSSNLNPPDPMAADLRLNMQRTVEENNPCAQY